MRSKSGLVGGSKFLDGKEASGIVVIEHLDAIESDGGEY